MEKINDHNFNKKAIEPKNPFALIFTSTYCPHCRTVEGYIYNIEQEKNIIGETKIFIVDAEKSPKLVEKYKIRSFPTTFFFGKDLMNQHTIIGATSINDFINGFEKIKKSISKKKKTSFFKNLFSGKKEK